MEDKEVHKYNIDNKTDEACISQRKFTDIEVSQQHSLLILINYDNRELLEFYDLKTLKLKKVIPLGAFLKNELKVQHKDFLICELANSQVYIINLKENYTKI